MSHDEDEGHGLGPVIWLTVACIVGALILVALVFQKDTTTFFIALNSKFTSLFESDLFIRLRFVAGIITVALTGLATWLFFRLLEMEKEHENHVYHATDHVEHTHESERHETMVSPASPPHLPLASEPEIQHDDHQVEASIEHVDTETIREAPRLDDLPKMPEMHHIDTQMASESVQTGPGSHASVMPRDASGVIPQMKTAPPPAKIFRERLPGESGVRGVQIGEEHPGRFKWQSVLRLATSQSESDWRLAIIEADVILDMMTYIQGFQGETLGERLKNADPGFFKTLDFAKKAHGVRNQIAHQPDIRFTPRELNQTIRMYEAVFNEFKYI